MPTSLKKLTTNFIGDERFDDWFDIDLPIYHCEFHKELYSDKLYEILGIRFPESLRNSVIKRRAEFLAGRYCAIRSLQKIGIDNTTIEIGKHRNPLWPENIAGSISHCNTHAIAITSNVSSVLGVGIDIEDEVDKETVEKIQGQIVCENEISLISCNIGEKPLLFTLAFSIKESFFKAAYTAVGQFFAFDAVSIVEIDRQACTISLRINKTLHEKLTKDMLIKGAFHISSEKKVVTLVILNH
jgi:enterobactin synthetase component D